MLTVKLETICLAIDTFSMLVNSKLIISLTGFINFNTINIIIAAILLVITKIKNVYLNILPNFFKLVIFAILLDIVKKTNGTTIVYIKFKNISPNGLRTTALSLNINPIKQPINDEIINIEIQLKNENNMVKRSLYYLSKMYEEQLNEKEDYSKLVRTVCINILNFKYLKTDNFHTGYRFKEIESNEELTDIMEVHFIEIPKLQDSSDEKDMLVAWTEFLKDPESEKVRGLELSIEEIRQAKDELIRMSNDSTQRELYDMRANSLRDKMSELNAAERKGIEKGREEGREEGRKEGIEEGRKEEKIEIARNMKLSGLDTNTIAKITNLSEDEIDKL